MAKHPDEGGTGVKDPIIMIDAIKIIFLKNSSQETDSRGCNGLKENLLM